MHVYLSPFNNKWFLLKNGIASLVHRHNKITLKGKELLELVSEGNF